MSTIKSSSEHLTLNADGASKDIKFQANGVEKASIDSSGNLTVSGNLTSVGIDDNADATAITIDSSENVGIGTSSPNYKLKIIGGADILNLENTSASSYEHLRFTVGSANARIVMTGESFGDANYGQGDLTLQTETSGGKIRFGTGASGVNKMIIGDDGISFNGDTAAANALDDYEEGTWTPRWYGTTSGASEGNPSNSLGKYTKIGNVVFISLFTQNIVDNESPAIVGNVRIDGLPFNTASTDKEDTILSVYLLYVSSTSGWIAQTQQNSDDIHIFNAESDFTELAIGDLGNFSDGTITGYYFTD